MRRADVNDDEERGLQVGRQGRDNSSKGLDASPRRSNDHNVSQGSCQTSRRAFSIAMLDADHPVPPLLGRYPRIRAAQNRRHHLVREKVVERCPGAVAFGAPMFMGDGEPFRAYRPPARATDDAAVLLESSTPDRDPEQK